MGSRNFVYALISSKTKSAYKQGKRRIQTLYYSHASATTRLLFSCGNKTNTYDNMKKILFPAIAAVALAFASCSSTSTHAPVVYTIDEVYAQADSLLGDTISFEGVCTHLCKHGGRKAFLVGNLTDTVLTETDTVIRPHILRVEGAKMGNFDAACINNVVRVRGVLHAYEYTPQPVADPAEKHGEGNQGCATEQLAIHGYFAEAVSYEIITAE